MIYVMMMMMMMLECKRRRNPIANKGKHYCLSIYINQMNGMNDKEGLEFTVCFLYI